MCIEDELAILGPIDFFNAGRSINEIAEITEHNKKHLIIMLKDALVVRTKTYLMQGKKVSEIAHILGVGDSTVKLWIKTYNLNQYWVSRPDIMGDKTDKSKIYSSFIKLQGIVELSEKFHMTH